MSVIIPCHPRNRKSLQRTLESLKAADGGNEAELIVVEDVESKGPSWARNRGLERATGEVVFFCDADDTVGKEFFSRPLMALAESRADMCFFTYVGGPQLQFATYNGNEAVRERFLPAFFGYSNADVRRWNAGGVLSARKEMGQVWRCAFRRMFLETHAIRFDEAISLFEDAAFLSACVARAECVVTIPDILYNYVPVPGGNLATGWRSVRNWEYKFVVLAFRRRLDEECGGELWRYCEASCVFSALELLKARHRLFEYLADAKVRAALRKFPLSVHHPAVALCVIALRALVILRKFSS